jgi:hypothetical protein
MRTTIVREGQTLLDISIQDTGDIQRLFEIAVANNKSITEDLVIGDEITTPSAEVNLQDVVLSFSSTSHKPASGLSADDLLQLQGGIGYMGVQLDFKVS